MESSEPHSRPQLLPISTGTQTLSLNIQYREENVQIEVPKDETIRELAMRCADRIGADLERISLFFMPKPGFTKFPFPEKKLCETITPHTRVKLVGTPKTEIKRMDDMGTASHTVRRPNNFKPVAASKSRDWKKVQEESTYTFHAIEPLLYLPNPEKSRRFLERLANDPGIKASMRKHKFSVGMLTEMNPAEHTTHESKTLGLNRNRGEVIELRLRTDRYDGYRDYKVIRQTLCHELSHNVYGDHNRDFYDLMKEIEKDVQAGDWKHGGHRLTEHEFYNPDDRADGNHADGGGWTGGDFVLGTSKDVDNDAGLSRREILARAAMNRQRKEKEAREQQEP